MAFIYKITNNVNNKVYVGKTLNSVDERWKEHLESSTRPRCNKRPLYDAMNKYGQEHFSIETIEECLDEQASDREIYWIDFYKSYHNGYNATKGGDGKPSVDDNAIRVFWLCGYTPNQISTHLGYCIETIRAKLRLFGVGGYSIRKRNAKLFKKSYSKPVYMCSLDGKPLKVFDSVRSAYEFLGKKGNGSHISECCCGKLKSAYGYLWRY